MSTRRHWRLDARPEGHDYEAALSLQEEILPELAEGQVRVAAQYLSMDAGVRVWMSAREDGYSPPIPLGATMQGQFIGRVEASRSDAFAEGDLVRGFGDWATHSTVDPALAGLTKLDADIDDVRQHFGVLGLNGMTALCGLTDVIGGLEEGQTVLVSAAAGATGGAACQIARNMGCKVYGIAGSPEKCEWLTGTLGLDGAIDYKRQNVAEEIAKIDGGIDVYFENVGGPILDAALPNMVLGGRIGICGLLSGYTSESGEAGPARFDQILMKRLTVKGIFLPDYLAQGSDYYPQLRAWYDEGKLVGDIDETRGIENTLQAFRRMLTGDKSGKVIVAID